MGAKRRPEPAHAGAAAGAGHGDELGRWQRRLVAMLAIKRMADGASLQQVAADLGYRSLPAFATMFKRTLGTSPGRDMAERHGER